MASEMQTQPRHLAHGAVWPPDDSEESVLGTDLHQTTITDLRLGLNEAARTGLGRGQPARWRAFSQIALLGCSRPDGSSYRTYPDVFVYQRPIDPARRRARRVAGDDRRGAERGDVRRRSRPNARPQP